MLSCLVPRFGQEDMPSSTKFDLQCKKIFFLSFINSLQLVAQERALRVDGMNEKIYQDAKKEKSIRKMFRENELNYLCHT